MRRMQRIVLLATLAVDRAGAGRLRRFRHGQARRLPSQRKEKTSGRPQAGVSGRRAGRDPRHSAGILQGQPAADGGCRAVAAGRAAPAAEQKQAAAPAEEPSQPKPPEAESRCQAETEKDRQARGAEAGRRSAALSRSRSNRQPRRAAARTLAERRRRARTRARHPHLGRRRRRRAPLRADFTFDPLHELPDESGKKRTRMSFTVAIVGRPNVGKSTLFNRLVGRRVALVDDRPGVTRDRREGEARLGDLDFTVIDTAGLEESAPETLVRPHARADRNRDRAGRRDLLHDRRALGADPGRPRLRRTGAQVGQADRADRQQDGRHGGAGRALRCLCAGPGRSGGAVGRA